MSFSNIRAAVAVVAVAALVLSAINQTASPTMADVPLSSVAPPSPSASENPGTCCGDGCDCCSSCPCDDKPKASPFVKSEVGQPPYPVGSIITDSTRPGRKFRVRSWYHDGTEWKANCDEVRQVTADNTASSMQYDGRSGWTYPGSIDSHLMTDHGISPSQLSTMDKRSMEALHDSLHNSGAGRVVRSAPVVSSGGCPGGVCPSPRLRPFRWR